MFKWNLFLGQLDEFDLLDINQTFKAVYRSFPVAISTSLL